MIADESRIRNQRAFVLDVRELSFRGFVEAFRVHRVWKVRQFQKHLGFGDERTRIWQAKGATEREKRNHGFSRFVRGTYCVGWRLVTEFWPKKSPPDVDAGRAKNK